jgi:hypothetical protein
VRHSDPQYKCDPQLNHSISGAEVRTAQLPESIIREVPAFFG